jgi:regulator of sigma E protease
MILLAFSWSALFANLGQFILSFSILVVLHELGHFLTAKWFGCRVEKFYLFFNPWFSLWKKKIGETEYGIGWVPLGRLCKNLRND